MDISELKQLLDVLRGGDLGPPMVIGTKYFIRTVTHHFTGRLTNRVGNWIVLDTAAWIADDGRFHQCLKDSNPSEVEPYISPVTINATTIIDYVEWHGELPTVQK